MEAVDTVARGPAQTSLMLNMLPPELLLMIFAYFAPARNVLPDQEYWLDRSDLFAIRSTCRAFRYMANELLFWVDDDFRVVETIPRRLSIYDDERSDATFLEIILSDRHLLACLARRKVWHFKNIVTLRVVLLKLPSFRRQPVSVHLLFDKLSSRYWLRASFNTAISELRVCHCLTSLVLLDDMEDIFHEGGYQLVDLDLIVQCCPTITLLRLICTCLDGTLQDLSNLQSLVVDDVHIDIASAFLPVQSAHSLTHLTVIYDPEDDIFFEDACADGTLELFRNLTSLFVHPLTDAMCDVLMGGHFRLKDFRTTGFGNVNLNKVIALFLESSLRGLRSLTMAFEDHYEWRSSYSALALAIATNLGKLESLVIGMGIDPVWCSHFSSLRKLRRIVWYVPESAWVHFPDPITEQENDFGPLETGTLDDFQRRLFKAEYTEYMFAKAFRHFVESPSVTVEVMNGWMYRVVHDCHAVPYLYDDNLYG